MRQRSTVMLEVRTQLNLQNLVTCNITDKKSKNNSKSQDFPDSAIPSCSFFNNNIPTPNNNCDIDTTIINDESSSSSSSSCFGD